MLVLKKLPDHFKFKNPTEGFCLLSLTVYTFSEQYFAMRMEPRTYDWHKSKTVFKSNARLGDLT